MLDIILTVRWYLPFPPAVSLVIDLRFNHRPRYLIADFEVMMWSPTRIEFVLLTEWSSWIIFSHVFKVLVA